MRGYLLKHANKQASFHLWSISSILCFYETVTYRRTDRPTNRQTYGPSDGRNDSVVVVAHSTSAQQILSGWGLTVVCEPIHLGGGDSRRMANTRQCAGSNPQPSSQRASAVTTAPPCAPMITLLGRCAETEKTFSKCTRSAVKNE